LNFVNVIDSSVRPVAERGRTRSACASWGGPSVPVAPAADPPSGTHAPTTTTAVPAGLRRSYLSHIGIGHVQFTGNYE
jgi:hypothetical protein